MEAVYDLFLRGQIFGLQTSSSHLPKTPAKNVAAISLECSQHLC